MTVDRIPGVASPPMRIPAPARIPLILAALLFATLASVVALRPSGGSVASEQPALPPPMPAYVPNLPASGALFHLEERVFARHGAAAGEIASWPAGSVLPETYVRDSWALVDADSRLVELYAVVRTEDGQVLQRSHTTADELVVEDVMSGDVRRSTRTTGMPVVLPPDVLAEQGWAHYQHRMDTGEVGFVRVGRIDGETLAIFIEQLPPSQVAPGTAEASDGSTSTTAVTVPFLGDLDLLQIKRHVAFADSNRELRFQEVTGVLSDGSQIVIEETRWLTRETLPSSAWDDIVQEGRTR
ncbi:MAG: hypothetical protein M0R73_10555 [Dehalococcoidia bacterium]|nr:hypothetical protein [Dehalococcoidia bacterium]